jgi:phosphopantothenoylcysteine synthetase/decarboxylase
LNVLVTAGNTLVPIDRVRCISNVFTGRTGARVALEAHGRGHHVRLLTSHPNVVQELRDAGPRREDGMAVISYRTFDDLHGEMERLIRGGGLDVIIHSAAVSDYQTGGVYAPAPGTRFDVGAAAWQTEASGPPRLADVSAGKVKSDELELWLRLVRTPKLVDQVRGPWDFPGVLVKFKLEVGITEEQLREIAERSRRHSDADLMVANTLEGAGSWALVGPLGGLYQRVGRREMPEVLLDAVEALHREKGDG